MKKHQNPKLSKLKNYTSTVPEWWSNESQIYKSKNQIFERLKCFCFVIKTEPGQTSLEEEKKVNSKKWKDSLLFLLFQVLYIEELYTKKGPCDNFFSTKETLILPRMIAEICFWWGWSSRKNCNIFVFIIYPDAACHNTVG